MTAHQFSNAVDRLMRLRRLKPERKINHRKVTADQCHEMHIRLCRNMEVSHRDVLSDSRDAGIVLARVIISHALHEELGMTTPQIAKMTNRVHSTIIHHLRLFDSLFEVRDRQFMRLLEKSKKL